jgi:glycosyltransferase involved in cell wall biosynthesis
MTTMKPSISVFFPCYNERGTIGDLVTQSLSLLQDLSDDFEVIVIDDGSTDGSRELLKELESQNPKVKIIFHEKNKGMVAPFNPVSRRLPRNLIFIPMEMPSMTLMKCHY